MSDGGKQRRYPRFSVEGVHGKMALTTEVEIVNISLGGMAIRSSQRLNVGSEYFLRLEVGRRNLSLKGVVVWSILSDIVKHGDDTIPNYSAGVKFSDVLFDKLQDLIDFIDQHKVSEEHRLSGIRFQIKMPGKALLDDIETYNVKLLSQGGMLIETDREFDVDQVYPMEILPPDEEPISFSGRVASVLEMEDEMPGRFQVGIEFTDMSQEDRARLITFIESVSGL